MQENYIIQFKQVTKTYQNNVMAINNLNFKIEQGELVFLAGHSGSGKSTILKLIAGIEVATSGEVIVNNINLSTIPSSKRSYIRQHIGLIFQDHKILFDRNIFENCRLNLDIKGIYSEEEIKSRVKFALNNVGLEHKLFNNPSELSGGEQQRLCIARAIVHNPKIILADEPTANLDRHNSLKIIELIKTFHQKGTTVIISAHDETILGDYGKRIIYLTNGQFRK